MRYPVVKKCAQLFVERAARHPQWSNDYRDLRACEFMIGVAAVALAENNTDSALAITEGAKRGFDFVLELAGGKS